jgi:predicted dehydrogenase
MSMSKRVLIVGAGSIGERHLRCFQATGRVEISLCELNPELRKKIADKYGVTESFGRLEEALAAGPEAVVIAAPAHLHTPMMMAAAEAGMHFLVEKPLSTSLEGIDRLLHVVQERRVTAAVAYTLRSHPVLAAMRDAVLSGRFGLPVEVVVVCGQNFPHCRPAYREIYYRDHATGGGAVQDALTHILDAAQWIVGPITSVAADLGRLMLEGVAVEDTAHVLARHAAVLANYSLNQHQQPDESTLTVHCQRGSVRFESHMRRWRWMTEPSGTWHDEPMPQSERDDWFVAQAGAFLDAIEGRCEPRCTLAEAAHTLRVHHAIFASAAERRWETVGDSPTC